MAKSRTKKRHDTKEKLYLLQPYALTIVPRAIQLSKSKLSEEGVLRAMP